MLAKDVYVALKREAEDGDGVIVIECRVKNLPHSRILEEEDERCYSIIENVCRTSFSLLLSSNSPPKCFSHVIFFSIYHYLLFVRKT